MTMKHTMTHNITKTAATFCASLSLAWSQAALASPSESGIEELLEGLIEETNIDQEDEDKGINLKAIAKNGRGTITYNGKKVWEGRVKDDLKAIVKVVRGKHLKYAEGTEVAAVWDGDKLVWENVKGAADELEPERLKLQEQKERLMDALKDLK